MQLTEPLVARVTGVKKSQLATLRQALLSKGPHWDLERNVVVYSREGLEKIFPRLGLRFEDFPWTQNQASADDSDDTPDETPIDATLSAPGTTAPQSEAIAPATKQAVTIEERRLLSGQVVRLSRNPIMLIAKVEDQEVCVRVRENKNFLPGMEVLIREPGPGSELWYFEGRLPRWKGRY
jgi:hypothetical protein